MLCFEWNVSKIQRKTLLISLGSGALKGTTLVLLVWYIKARSLLTSVLERSKSLLIHQKSQWPRRFVTLLHCLQGIFLSHSPFLLKLKKTWCLHLDDPWGTDPIPNPFYLGAGETQKQTKTIPWEMWDVDLKIVQIHVLIICLLQLSSIVNIWWQPKSLFESFKCNW